MKALEGGKLQETPNLRQFYRFEYPCVILHTPTDTNSINVDISNASLSRQLWSIQDNGNGSFRILSECSNLTKGLTVEGASMQSGANVFQYTYTGSGSDDNDDWIFESVNNFTIIQTFDFNDTVTFLANGDHPILVLPIEVTLSEYYSPDFTGSGTITYKNRWRYVGVSNYYDDIIKWYMLNEWGFTCTAGVPQHYDQNNNCISNFQYVYQPSFNDDWYSISDSSTNQATYQFNTTNTARFSMQMYLDGTIPQYFQSFIFELGE